ncbi:acetyltransferase [Leekyejoonella antrihumi]|uniref:Acetyltransferase n=2 Tax=Leekyejoonella antrihumi TaxID=1660198 RepID=A0A563E0S0_9MICO|nr:acetyltransferase [Leekyejoonella antrihumi]
MQRLYIVGCGGFGREVHDIVNAENEVSPTWEFAGYIDDTPSEENLRLVSRRGAQVVGGIAHALELQPAHFVIGIGTGRIRESVATRLEAAGWMSAVLVHPAASLGADVELGPGSVICAGARLTTNITLGHHVHININSTVGHDSTFDSYATVNPLAAISGGVSVGERSMVGTHAAILQNLNVGVDSIVGAGSLVTKSVPDNTVVKGVPAR